MAAKAFVVAPKDYAPVLNLVGEHITVLASGEATEGYEVFLQRGPEGSGPPAHSHPWTSPSLSSTARSISASVPSRRRHHRARLFIFPPAPHWFRFGRGGAEMISMTSRLGASRMFTDLAREVAPVDPDLGKLAEVGARHGLKVAEP